MNYKIYIYIYFQIIWVASSDQDHVKYDQVELDTELDNIRNKHHLASAEENRPQKRQKRWHIRKERNKKKVQTEVDEVSLPEDPQVLSSIQPEPSKVLTHVVKENCDHKKHFPIFNLNDNANSTFNQEDKIETPKFKAEEDPKSNPSVAAKKKIKSNSSGNHSIIKFLTPLRGKAPTKPSSSSDPPNT